MSQYCLPNDTARHVARTVQDCQHPGLRLEKYIPRSVIESAMESSDERDRSARAAWLAEVAETWNRRVDTELWQGAETRWAAVAASMGATTWRATLIDRLIVGLGHNTVLETGLTLHHTWGLPVLPGSALKGLARAWATLEEEADEAIQQVFGAPPEAAALTTGDVVFLDALPLTGTSRVQLAVDIMNPHYSDYYRDPSQPPADYISPIPIFFLTVRGGVWDFGVAARRGASVSRAAQSVARASEWLKAALQHMGAGGKTGAGYGYFQIDQVESFVPRAATTQAAAAASPLASEPATEKTSRVPQPEAGPPVRTTLTVLRVDSGREAYRVEPRTDAIPKIAQQYSLPLDQLRDESTRWYLPLDAFKQTYGKRATTPACEIDRIERDAGDLVIWMKPAPPRQRAEP